MILTLIVMTSMFPALVLLVPLYRLFVGVEIPFLSDLFGSPYLYAEPAQHLLGADYSVCCPQSADCYADSHEFLSADSG